MVDDINNGLLNELIKETIYDQNEDLVIQEEGITYQMIYQLKQIKFIIIYRLWICMIEKIN